MDSRVDTAPTQPLLAVVSYDAKRSGPLCPWQTTERWKKWALQEYRVWQADVDHGTVAIVLVLNRLLLPLPLHQISDWVAQTVLVAVLGVKASEFNGLP